MQSEYKLQCRGTQIIVQTSIRSSVPKQSVFVYGLPIPWKGSDELYCFSHCDKFSWQRCPNQCAGYKWELWHLIHDSLYLEGCM